MVRRLIAFALQQPMFVSLLTLLFVAAGVAAFRSVPIEAFPDVTDVQVTVISLFSGHAPEEVEKQVTVPVELALSGLPHCARMFSHTQFGLSYVILTFDDAVNDYFARQQVLERLQEATLPDGVEPQLAPLSTPIGEIFRYRLAGQGRTPTELRTIQDWTVARTLRRVPGVADVVSLGGFIKQYQVAVDLARLKSFNATLPQLFTALGRSNANAGGSTLDRGEQQYLIRGIGLLRSPDDIGNVVVAQRNGTPLLVKDVAEVTLGSVPRQGTVGEDEDDEIVSGIVLMRKGENPSDVLEALKAKVDELNKSILPRSVEIVPFYDRTWLIDTTLHTVFKNLLEGALLVAGVLLLFLSHLRSALIVTIVIPLALLATFLGLQLRGIPANLLSLGAMDFGIIVDGAVIVVENVLRRLGSASRVGRIDEARPLVLEAASEVGRPTLFAMLIIITAQVPIFALQRQEGRIFAPMAYTVGSALIGSLLFSLTLVPLLCLWLLRKRLPAHENLVTRFCKRAYRPLLSFALRHRFAVLGSAVVALVGSFAVATRLGSEFLPELNEGTLWLNVTLPPSISVNEASRQCALLRSVLRKFPEVRTVVSKAGRPEDGTDPKPINMAEFFIDVKPREEWKRAITKDELIEEMDHALQVVPGVETSFSQPIRDNILESISQIDGQVVIKVFGEDLDVLEQKAREILAIVAAVRGVSAAAIDRIGAVPQFQIEIDRDCAARYGLNVADVQDVIETALGGKAATQIWEGEKQFGVVVRLRDEDRCDFTTIGKTLVDTADGLRVPLESVSKMTVRDGSMNISREDGTRLKAISVFIRGRDMGSVVAEMQQKVKQSVTLPSGYVVAWGGEFENQQRAMARLRFVVPISVFLIFLWLFNAFRSVKRALLVLGTVPLALIGGILALFATGIPLSVSAAIGFIALSGQAVLNGVVMVTCFNQLRESGQPLQDAITDGSLIRLRTVLMTALLAMFGLLPMALSHEIGSEVQRPLAIVIIGGLVSATLLTLFVLPAAYHWIEARSDSSRGPGDRVDSGRELA